MWLEGNVEGGLTLAICFGCTTRFCENIWWLGVELKVDDDLWPAGGESCLAFCFNQEGSQLSDLCIRVWMLSTVSKEQPCRSNTHLLPWYLPGWRAETGRKAMLCSRWLMSFSAIFFYYRCNEFYGVVPFISAKKTSYLNTPWDTVFDGAEIDGGLFYSPTKAK